MTTLSAPPLPVDAFDSLFQRLSNWGRWGPDDQRGTLNFLTPEHAARAAGLVSAGTTVSCALPLNTVPDVDNPHPAIHSMVRAGDVVEQLPVPSTSDWLLLMPHGAAHSHLDALCHFSWRGKMYNGRPVSEVTSTGARSCDVTIGAQGIVGRGVLLDIPRLLGVEWIELGTAITPSQLEEAEQAAGLQVAQGDILFVRTGRHRRREVHGGWPYYAGLAGLHHDCVGWLSERRVAVLGSDGGSDVVPSPFEGVVLPVHALTLVALGMQLLDNLNLDDLARVCAEQGRWEYLLTVAPLRLSGGTGSAVNPIALF